MTKILDDPVAILESITDAFYALNAQWEFVYLNSQAERVLQRDRKYLLGKNIWCEYPALVGSEFETLYRDVVERKIPGAVTSYYPDHLRWYEVHVYPGKEGISVYFRDVTARIEAEEVLRESELRFRLMADSIPQIVWITDETGRAIFFNQQWSNYTGVPAGPMAAEKVSENFVHPDDDQRTIEEWNRARRTGTIFNIEHRIRSADGEYRWFLVRAEPYRDPKTGEIVRWFGTSTDVHDQKLTESALKRSEARYRSLFESIDEGFCVIDMMFDASGNAFDYRFCEVNPAFERQSGLRDAVGKTMLELAPRNEAYWFEIYGHVSVTGQPIRFVSESKALGRWFDVYAFRLSESESSKVAILFTDITDRKLAEDTVRHASLHDVLTGLSNRKMLFEYAGHILPQHSRAGQLAAVLFVDLDRFKPINDTHGHEAGDVVIKEVARRLSQTLRAGDIISRIGGDEFAILLQDIKGASYASDVARHVIQTIGNPYAVGELSLSLSASVGISIFPQDGQDIATLLSHADMAMYQAKQAGRDNFQFYSPQFTEEAKLQRIIESQLKATLIDKAFYLCYQPVLDVRTGQVVSVEALLRWQNAEVGPDRFVPIAETTGIINSIGRWLRTEACRQFKKWISHGLPPIPIAVNVSAVEFRDKDFVKQFSQALQSNGVDISALQLEMTETAVMVDVDYAVTVLSKLRELGVKVLLDDFGTGYSSLAYLARLPIAKIKIDKSFIARLKSDMASVAITDAMIALGRTLNLDVVAEGIESQDILQFLDVHGCTQAQGYFLGEPMPGDDFEAWYWQHQNKLQASACH